MSHNMLVWMLVVVVYFGCRWVLWKRVFKEENAEGFRLASYALAVPAAMVVMGILWLLSWGAVTLMYLFGGWKYIWL